MVFSGRLCRTHVWSRAAEAEDGDQGRYVLHFHAVPAGAVAVVVVADVRDGRFRRRAGAGPLRQDGGDGVLGFLFTDTSSPLQSGHSIVGSIGKGCPAVFPR